MTPFVVLWRIAVHKSHLPKRAKLVAYTVSMFMDSDGKGAHPSEETLAERAGVSRSTVARAIVDLRRGWLDVGKKRVRRGPGGCVNTYAAVLPAKHGEERRKPRDPFEGDPSNVFGPN